MANQCIEQALLLRYVYIFLGCVLDILCFKVVDFLVEAKKKKLKSPGYRLNMMIFKLRVQLIVHCI